MTTLVATTIGMTPLYASPEQLSALGWPGWESEQAPPITRATDIWSLGLVLLEARAGGEASWSPGKPDFGWLDRAREMCGEQYDAWDEGVDALLRAMLSVDPRARPSAAEVVSVLEPLTGREPLRIAVLRADGLNNRAVSLLDLDAKDEARGLLAEALTLDPFHPEAVYNAALLAWRAGDISDVGALDRMRQVQAFSDEHASLLEAWIQVERGDEAGAREKLGESWHAPPQAIARASLAVRAGLREVQRFRAHDGIADAMALQGDLLVTGGREGAVRVFELASGRRLHELRAHTGYVFGVALTEDRKRLFSAGWDGQLRGFDVASKRAFFQASQPGKLQVLLLSPDGRHLWSGSLGGTLRQWSVDGERVTLERELLALDHDLSILCLALSPDGRTLLAGSEDRFLRFFDVETGERVREIRLPSQPNALAFASRNDRMHLFVGAQDQQVTIHDPATAAQVAALRGMQSWVSVVAVSPCGRWLVCNHGLQFQLWDLDLKRCQRTFEAPALLTEALFLPGGDLLTLDWAGWVRRYEIAATELAPVMLARPRMERELLSGQDAVVGALAMALRELEQGNVGAAVQAARQARREKAFERSPDVLAVWEKLGRVAGRKGIRAVWPLDQWGPVKASSGLALDPGRRFVAAADPQGTVTLWPLGPGAPAPLREFRFPEEELASRALAVSPDGTRLAIGTYKRLHLIDLDGGSQRTSEIPQGYVRDVAFDGEGLVGVLDDDGHAHVLRVENLDPVATMQGPESWVNTIAFLGKNRLVVGDYRGHLLLWSITKAAQCGFTPGERGSDGTRAASPREALVRDLGKKSPAGSRSVHAAAAWDGRIVYACADGKLHVVDASGKEHPELPGHEGPVSCFDLAGEHHALTGSFDRTVSLFDLRSGQRLVHFGGHTHAIWAVVSLDEHHFLTASDDGQIRRFYVDWEIGAEDG